MLRGSILASQRVIGGAGYRNSGKKFYTNYLANAIQIQNRDTISRKESFPLGYRANKAIYLPIQDGGIAGRASLSVSVVAAVRGVGYASPNAISISVIVSANGNMLASIYGSAFMSIDALCSIMGIGYIEGLAEISARPTAYDIAQEVWISNAAALNIDNTMGGKINQAGSATGMIFK